MLAWKRYKSKESEIEAISLTRENLEELTLFLVMEGKAVSGGLGGASLGSPATLTINGVKVVEGDWVFKRLADGAVGAAPAKTFEQYAPV